MFQNFFFISHNIFYALSANSRCLFVVNMLDLFSHNVLTTRVFHCLIGHEIFFLSKNYGIIWTRRIHVKFNIPQRKTNQIKSTNHSIKRLKICFKIPVVLVLDTKYLLSLYLSHKILFSVYSRFYQKLFF